MQGSKKTVKNLAKANTPIIIAENKNGMEETSISKVVIPR
jgi:hypothetical protein